jgi:hypothetical protein
MKPEQLAKFEARFGKLAQNRLGNWSSEQEEQLQGWLAAIELLVMPLEDSLRTRAQIPPD